VKGFDHVPSRIVKTNPVSDSPLVGEGALKTLNTDTGSVEARGQCIQSPTIGNFPSEKRRAFSTIGMDHDPLPPIVHPECQRRRGAIDKLHAEELRTERRPVVNVARPDADVAE
jgi:hypothetical protein